MILREAKICIINVKLVQLIFANGRIEETDLMDRSKQTADRSNQDQRDGRVGGNLSD